MDIEELKLRVAHEWDVLDFLDAIDMSFPELIDILFEVIDEDAKKRLMEALD